METEGNGSMYREMIELWRKHEEQFDDGTDIVDYGPQHWPMLITGMKQALESGVPFTDEDAYKILGWPPKPEGAI